MTGWRGPMPTGMDERLIAFLRFRPDLLFDFDPAHNPVAFPSPRSWEFAHRALQKFGDQPPSAAAGLAGLRRAGRRYRTQGVRRQSRQPAGHRCHSAWRGRAGAERHRSAVRGRRGPGGAVQSVPSANGNANETYGRILDYARRFPQREMGVMLVSDMQRAIGRRAVRGAAVCAVGELDRRRDAVRHVTQRPVADDPVELKLSAARTRLILDKPFLGALVLRLPMIEADPELVPHHGHRCARVLLQSRVHRCAEPRSRTVHAGARGAALRTFAFRPATASCEAPLGRGLRPCHQSDAG